MGIPRSPARGGRRSVLGDREQSLQGPLRPALIAPVLVDHPVPRVPRQVEALLKLVAPDHRRADHRDRPETSAAIAPRMLLPPGGRDADEIPKAALGRVHPVPSGAQNLLAPILAEGWRL